MTNIIGEVIHQTTPTAQAWDFRAPEDEDPAFWATVGIQTIVSACLLHQEVTPASVGIMSLLLETLAATMDTEAIIAATESTIRNAAIQLEEENQQ